MPNPQELMEMRQAYEGNLVFNQVWVDPDKKEESEEEALTPPASARSRTTEKTRRPRRATSVGVLAPHPSGCATETPASWSQRGRDKQETLAQGRSMTDKHQGKTSRETSRDDHRVVGHRRARSQGTIPTVGNAELTLCPELRETLRLSTPETRDADRRRKSSHASGCPKPGRDSSVKAKPTEYESPIRSRIQLIDDDEEDMQECVGSLAVQQATRMQRRFEHKLRVESEENVKPQALWLSLDPLTGEVSCYSRAASTRLEAAHVSNRNNVPLAGLGDMRCNLEDANRKCNIEDAIVHLGLKGSGELPVQKSLQGGQMDVRRLSVRPDVKQVNVNVVWDHGWRIADVAVPGTTEERYVLLNGTETVRPPSPPLPPLNPDRRCNTAGIRPWWGDVETW